MERKMRQIIQIEASDLNSIVSQFKGVELRLGDILLTIRDVAYEEGFSGWLVDDRVVITCDDGRVYPFGALDTIQVRYHNPDIIDCLPRPYPAPLVRNDEVQS
jgi:hypothetical protein